MDYLFYFPIVLAIIYELAIISDPETMKERVQRYKETEPEDYSYGQKSFRVYAALYLFWIVFGLFTSSALLFVLLLLLGLFKPKTAHQRSVIASVSLFLLLMIIVNKFHFPFL